MLNVTLCPTLPFKPPLRVLGLPNKKKKPQKPQDGVEPPAFDRCHTQHLLLPPTTDCIDVCVCRARTCMVGLAARTHSDDSGRAAPCGYGCALQLRGLGGWNLFCECILYPVTAPYVACVFFFVRLHRCISASRRVLGLWAMLSMGQEINHESYVWKGGFK